MDEFLLRPDPDDPRLTQTVSGIDQEGRRIETAVVHERPLTLFLNRQEIVTMMTIGDYPEYLAVGYLLNQNMLRPDDVIAGIDYDEELMVVVVRTERATDYEEKLKNFFEEHLHTDARDAKFLQELRQVPVDPLGLGLVAVGVIGRFA